MEVMEKVRSKIDSYVETIADKPKISLQEFNLLKDIYSSYVDWNKSAPKATAKAPAKGVKAE